MEKSPDAFRTISEVADWLGTPTHVLRFWESRFSQVKPVKRAGGRRYYRPKDMELLGGIKKLLHSDGMTIRGVQKMLRKDGVRHVAAMSAPVDVAQVIEAVDDEAAIQLNAVPDAHENVVPLQDMSRIQALAKKHAQPRKQAPSEGSETVELGPRGDVLEGPDQRHLDAAAKPDTYQKNPKRSFQADVPEDPVDGEKPAPAISTVAAALRNAAHLKADNPPDEGAFGEIYDRLVRLKKSMDETPSGTPSK